MRREYKIREISDKKGVMRRDRKDERDFKNLKYKISLKGLEPC